MADYSGYLDPAIVNYVQGLPATDPLALQTTLGPRGTGMPGDPLPAPAPPPPLPPPPPEPAPGGGTGRKGGEPAPPTRIGLFGAPGGEEIYGLPPEIVAHVQGAPIEQPSTVPSVTGGALPTDPGLAPTAPVQQPDLAPVAIPQMNAKQVAASNRAVDKQQAQQAAYEASPEGLAAKADAEQRASIAKEQQANQDALAAEQAQNTATANALKASADRQADQDKIDQAKIAEQQTNVEKYTQQYAQQVKDAADYKVDTNRDVGVRGLIAIALSGIGNALDHNHGPNAAAQIIESQIDKRIADQWAQKRELGAQADATKGVMQTFRQNADDDRQAQALHTAAETKRAADEIRQIGAQYANPAAKARAESVAAQLDAKAAGITMGEAQRKAQAIKDAQEERDRQAGIGLQYAQLKQNDAHFNAQMDQAKQFHDDDVAEKVLALTKQGKDAEAAALQKQQEELKEGGLMAPMGTRKDAQGNTVAKYDYLKQDDGTPFIASKDVAPKMHEQYDGYVGMIDALDRVRRLRMDNGGHVVNTEEARAATQALEDALMAGHQALGVEGFRGNILEVVEKKLTGGGDVNSVVKSVLPELNNARSQAVRDLNRTMHNRYGYTGDDLKFTDPLAASSKPAESEQMQRNRVLEATVPEADQDMTTLSGYATRVSTPEGRDLVKRANAAGVFPAQLDVLDQLGAQLKNPDTADSARKALQDIRDNPAIQPSVKKAALALLGSDLASTLPASAPVETPALPQPSYIVSRLPGGTQ